jgi:hypothetical protein
MYQQPAKKGQAMEDIANEPHQAYAYKLEFIETAEGQVICPTCGSDDLEQFGIDGFWCNNCNLRIS